jgi:nicotinic acid mononucleotide adenylyltransferase
VIHRCAEEDRIVSKWLVYALARASQVDAAACDALYSALTSDHVGEDALRVVRRASEASVDVLDGICGETAGSGLTSVCFLPGQQDATPVVAARGFAFRGVVLPGSFNPLHAGHVELAQAAQRKLLATTGCELPIGFEMAVANADKGDIPVATVLARVRQFAPGPGGAGAAGLGAWPVLVTNATLFGHKAELLRGCTFVIGADTAVRIVDPKYYAQDAHRMVLALQRIADCGCSFVVAGRFDAQTQRFVAAEDVLARHVPPTFRHLFVPLSESDYRNDISSTLLRQRATAEGQ